MVRNKHSVFANIGASTHGKHSRAENDYYSTDPLAVTLLHNHNLLDKQKPYYDFCCGGGNLGNELRNLNYNVEYENDLFDRCHGVSGVNFFDVNIKINGNLIANPPYKFINDWIIHSLDICLNKIYIFCRIQTIESIKRYELIFKNNPPVYICPFVKRINCYRNNDTHFKQSAVCYSWFIWDNKINNKNTIVKWLI